MEGVRPATDDDLARVAELARTAIAELTPMKGGVVWANNNVLFALTGLTPGTRYAYVVEIVGTVYTERAGQFQEAHLNVPPLTPRPVVDVRKETHARDERE